MDDARAGLPAQGQEQEDLQKTIRVAPPGRKFAA